MTAEVEALAATVVQGALRWWAGGDVEALARKEEGGLLAGYVRRLAGRMAEPVARRIESALPGEPGPGDLAAIGRVRDSLRGPLSGEDADELDRGLPDLSADLPEPTAGFYFGLRRECCAVLVQTARSLPLYRPGVLRELVRQQNTIVERLTDLATLLFAGLPSGVRGTLMRCALPSRFDEGLYDAVLRGDGPPLAEMAAAGRLRRLPGSRHHRLDPALRETAWSRWWIDEARVPGEGVPDAMRETARRIADEVDDELEELRLTALVSPGGAVAAFGVLYRRADTAFDLVACQDALDVLAAPDLIGVSPLIAETHATFQARLAARTAHATEYRQTGRYLHREALERVLTGDARVVHLHAPGGMGKTMLLRWFAARWCLTRWPHVPCARIDLDTVDPVNAVRHPWLVLLEIAAQLSPQIPGAPFFDLLRDHDRWRRVLSRAAVPDTALLSEVADAAADAADVTRRFFAAGLPDHVVVFDTLEEIVLRPAADPRPLVETLARLSGRLVLSGRYDLRDRLPGFADAFPDAETVEVPPFDDDLATRYLTERRGVRRPDLIDAMVRRAGGLPFALAMYGDLAEANPELTAREVEEAREPALLYCLDRILERIPDDRLRWLLRYAVLPRHLDAEFVTGVLWPHLEAGLRDDRVLDDPAEDARPDRKTKIFLPGPPPPAPAALWEELTTYAGATSWVRPTDDGRLIFHENLRGPVRDLLRDHPVHAVLHASAEDHYTRRAAREHWSRWSAEAVYHAFQHQGTAALPMWRALVAEAWRAGRADRAGELADDLLTYARDDEVRYAAAVEQARAAIEAARRDPTPGASGAHWNRAESALSEAGRLGEPSPMHRALTAMVHLARDRHEEAEAELAMIAGEDLDDDTAAEVDLARAVSADQEELRQVYARAEDRGDRRGIEFTARALGLSIAAQDGVLDEAARYLTESGDLPELARLLLRRGRPGSALAVFPGEPPTGIATGRERDRVLVTAEAMIALRRPAAADRLLTGRVSADHAGSAIVRARALGGLMEYEIALDALTHARRLATLGADRKALSRETARLHLEVAGDAGAAERTLGENSDDVLNPDPLWVDIRLAQGRDADAEGIAARMAAGSSAPADRVKAAVSGLQAGLPVGRDLVRYLRQIDDLGLRLESLRELRKCALRVDLSAVVLDPWLAERAQWERQDRACLDLLAVEAARVAGRPDDAALLLDEAVFGLASSDVVIWLDWIRAKNRIGPATSGEWEPPEIEGGPGLTGAFLVELARRRLTIDPEWKTSSRLDRGRELVGDRPMAWHATLWETLADLAASQGRPDHDHRRRAISVWEELGQSARLPAIEAPTTIEFIDPAPPTTDRPEPEIDDDPDWPDVDYEGRLDFDDADSADLASDAEDDELDSPGSGHRAAGLDWRPADGEPPDHEPEVVVSLGGLLPAGDDWTASPARNGLGEQLLPGLHDWLADSRRPVDVRLDGDAGGAPWELLGWDGRPLSRHPRIRCVYRTPARLAPVEKPLGRRPPVVQIVQPELVQAARTRGVPGSLKIAEVYRNRDLTTETRAPLEALGRREIGVLHLAGVMDTARGVPSLSFLGDDDGIGPGALHEVLRRLRGNPPLVVLDVLAPANHAEFSRQLFLRNLFAQEMVRVTFPVTVLAVGPAPGLTRSVAITDVAFAVAAGSSTPGLWQRLQSHEITSADDAYAFAATALFSNVRPAGMPGFR
ncbi:ATP-binding protein [Herbidospora cretacea]|uniref:NACHT N-terminal Helical domain 1-containing protein n=1 Tax=Herbidospora cretacea TaxID=28444 RepID=UPI0004C3B26E|nr:ATP-binding protein [Herbidospora cretacea]